MHPVDNTAIQALIMGIVQGLTEFLPISSTAHLRIVPAFAGWDDPGAAFTAVVQLGTLASVHRPAGEASLNWLSDQPTDQNGSAARG